MPKYNIFIKPSAVNEIEKILLKKDRRRIVDLIKKLADNLRPHGCEKLSGRDHYRLRQGRYRVVYSIKDRDLAVCVVKIGHRKLIKPGFQIQQCKTVND